MGPSVDTMQRPQRKIGGYRACWRDPTMARTISIVLSLTCPRTLHESPPNDEVTCEAPPTEHLTLCQVRAGLARV